MSFFKALDQKFNVGIKIELLTKLLVSKNSNA